MPSYKVYGKFGGDFTDKSGRADKGITLCLRGNKRTMCYPTTTNLTEQHMCNMFVLEFLVKKMQNMKGSLEEKCKNQATKKLKKNPMNTSVFVEQLGINKA